MPPVTLHIRVHTHTIKPPRAGVQQVGHISIKHLTIMYGPVCRIHVVVCGTYMFHEL